MKKESFEIEMTTDKGQVLRCLLNIRLKGELIEENIDAVIDYFRDEFIEMYNAVYEKNYTGEDYNEHFEDFCYNLVCSINEY